MKKYNYTNCYLLIVTILFLTTLFTARSAINDLRNKCNELEKEINTIKNEAEPDYQSLIQLHQDNN